MPRCMPFHLNQIITSFKAELPSFCAQTLQTLYARMIYRVADIRWEHRFEEVLVEEPTQCGGGRQLCIDFHRRA